MSARRDAIVRAARDGMVREVEQSLIDLQCDSRVRPYSLRVEDSEKLANTAIAYSATASFIIVQHNGVRRTMFFAPVAE